MLSPKIKQNVVLPMAPAASDTEHEAAEGGASPFGRSATQAERSVKICAAIAVGDDATPGPFQYEASSRALDSPTAGKQYTRLTAQIAAKSARRQSQLGSMSKGSGQLDDDLGSSSGPFGILKKDNMSRAARLKARLQRINQSLIVRPGSARLQNWFFVCVAMALVSGWVLPFHFAFMEAGGLLQPYGDWVAIMEYLGTFIFFADFLVRFCISYVDPETGSLVASRRKIARHYLLSWQCLLDVLGWFPFDWIVVEAAAAHGASEQTLVGLAWVKLMHLARLYRVFELFADLDYRMVVSQGTLLLTRNYTYVVYCTHWAACVLYHIAHEERFRPESWVGRNAARFVGQPVMKRYLLSLYFSISTFTSLGDGSLYASTVPEAGFMILYIMFNLFLGAYILGTVTMLVVKGDERSKEFRDLMSNLNEFSRNHELPERLTSAMQEHLEVTFNTEQVDDEHVLGIYPTTIRRKVLRHLYLAPVKSCYLFRGCKQRFLDAILTAAHVELFMPGVQMMTEGDNVTELNIIVSGAAMVAEAGINLSAAFQQFSQAASDPSRNGGSTRNGGLPDRSVNSSRRGDVSMSTKNGSSRHEISVHSAAAFMELASTKKILTKYSSDALAETPFFTDVPSNETIMSQSVVRVLSLPKSAWETLMAQFPQQARLVLNNLQNHAELALNAELHDASDVSGMSEDQLKQALLVMKDMKGNNKEKDKNGKKKGGAGGGDEKKGGGGGAGGDEDRGVRGGRARGKGDGPKVGKEADHKLLAQMYDTLPQSTIDYISRLHDVRAVVRAHVRKVDQVRTFEFLGCASDGDLETLRAMLNQGISPNACDYDGRTGLMLAAAAGHEAAVRLLLDNGAKSDQLDAFGNSAMCDAVKNSHDNVIDLLLSYGATLGMDAMAVASTMCTAVFEGDLVKLRRLLRSGAPPDACDYDKRSALHIAGAEGNLAAVKLLIEEGGADPHFQDRWGNTALDEARRVGAAPVVNYLETLLGREQLAVANARYRERLNAEFLTACSTGDQDRARFMAAHLQPGCVFTGLALAASAGHKRLVEALLVWVPTDTLLADGFIALTEAARMGRPNTVAVLRAAGVKLPDPRDGSLLTALHTAVLSAEVPVVAALLAAGVDAGAAKHGGGGLLHAAVLTGDLEVVRRLVEDGGMPPAMEDSAGKTPAAVAEAAKQPRIAEYLRWAASAALAAAAPAAAQSLGAAAAARFGSLPNYAREGAEEEESGSGSDSGSDDLAPVMRFGGADADPDIPMLLAHMAPFPRAGTAGSNDLPLSRDSSLQRGGAGGKSLLSMHKRPITPQKLLDTDQTLSIMSSMEPSPLPHHFHHGGAESPDPAHHHHHHHHGGAEAHHPPAHHPDHAPSPHYGQHGHVTPHALTLTGFLHQSPSSTGYNEPANGGRNSNNHSNAHAHLMHGNSGIGAAPHKPSLLGRVSSSRNTTATGMGGGGSGAGSVTDSARATPATYSSSGLTASAAALALSAPNTLSRPYSTSLPALAEDDGSGHGTGGGGAPPAPPPAAPLSAHSAHSPVKSVTITGLPSPQPQRAQDVSVRRGGANAPSPLGAPPAADSQGGLQVLARLKSYSNLPGGDGGSGNPGGMSFVLETVEPTPVSVTAAAAAAAARSGPSRHSLATVQSSHSNGRGQPGLQQQQEQQQQPSQPHSQLSDTMEVYLREQEQPLRTGDAAGGPLTSGSVTPPAMPSLVFGVAGGTAEQAPGGETGAMTPSNESPMHSSNTIEIALSALSPPGC